MKALIVGYGSIGKRHIQNLINYSNIEIIVCTKRKQDNFLKKNHCKIITSLKKCINENPDFAIISNVTSSHMKTAIELANAGIHLLIEKTLSNNENGVKRLQSIVKRKKLITLMGCHLRFHPCIIKIKEMIEIDGPVIADICVDKEENCFPMIQSGSAHNEMVLNKGQKQDAKSAEKGKVLV